MIIFVDERQWPSINFIGCFVALGSLISDLQDYFYNISHDGLLPLSVSHTRDGLNRNFTPNPGKGRFQNHLNELCQSSFQKNKCIVIHFVITVACFVRYFLRQGCWFSWSAHKICVAFRFGPFICFCSLPQLMFPWLDSLC